MAGAIGKPPPRLRRGEILPKASSTEGAVSRRLTEDTLSASADAPRTVAAALLAAVTTTIPQETAPNEQGHIVRRKCQLEPQPLFGRGGLGERRFS